MPASSSTRTIAWGVELQYLDERLEPPRVCRSLVDERGPFFGEAICRSSRTSDFGGFPWIAAAFSCQLISGRNGRRSLISLSKRLWL
jgi:hypothetical protein